MNSELKKKAGFSEYKSGAGFTLIEIMITVAITAFMAAILISYSHKSGQQIILNTEKAKIAQTISRIKSMTLTGFTKPPSMPPPCAYGFYIDYAKETYSIFNYSPSYGCENIFSYDIDDPNDPTLTSYKNTSTEKLSPEVKFGNPGAGGATRLGYILFIPPEPKAIVFDENRVALIDPVAIYLTTQDESLSTSIEVNNLTGQLSL